MSKVYNTMPIFPAAAYRCSGRTVRPDVQSVVPIGCRVRSVDRGCNVAIFQTIAGVDAAKVQGDLPEFQSEAAFAEALQVRGVNVATFDGFVGACKRAADVVKVAFGLPMAIVILALRASIDERNGGKEKRMENAAATFAARTARYAAKCAQYERDLAAWRAMDEKCKVTGAINHLSEPVKPGEAPKPARNVEYALKSKLFTEWCARVGISCYASVAKQIQATPGYAKCATDEERKAYIRDEYKRVRSQFDDLLKAMNAEGLAHSHYIRGATAGARGGDSAIRLGKSVAERPPSYMA